MADAPKDARSLLGAMVAGVLALPSPETEVVGRQRPGSSRTTLPHPQRERAADSLAPSSNHTITSRGGRADSRSLRPYRCLGVDAPDRENHPPACQRLRRAGGTARVTEREAPRTSLCKRKKTI